MAAQPDVASSNRAATGTAPRDALLAVEHVSKRFETSEGVISAVGVGMTEATMLARFIRETDIDVVLEAGVYTLLDTQASLELLPEAARRGVTVIAAQAMHGGLIDAPYRCAN